MMEAEQMRVVFVGAGATGTPLLEVLLARGIVDVIMVCDLRPDAPGMELARASGVPTTQDLTEVMRLGEPVDLVFDMTGDPGVRTALRLQLQLQNNRHTVIVHEKIALLALALSQGRQPMGHGSSRDYA